MEKNFNAKNAIHSTENWKRHVTKNRLASLDLSDFYINIPVNNVTGIDKKQLPVLENGNDKYQTIKRLRSILS